MNEEELKALMDEQFTAFKASLGQFADKESMETALGVFKEELNAKFEGLLTNEKFEELETAMKAQGAVMTALKLAGDSKEKSFREILKENHEDMVKAVANSVPFSINATVKTVTSANSTASTLAARQGGVGQIQRGMPYIRDMFNVVTLNSNTGGDIKWWEQLAVTNNAGAVAEATAPSTQSNLTWVEKTLSGKRIADFVKVGKDQIKDFDYTLGEIQRLVNRNMRLKENDALINGNGSGTAINGILSYATTFATAGISIATPNLVDLVGKHITQIETQMLGGAVASDYLINRIDTDNVRFSKASDGQYIFPNWAVGGEASIAGLRGVENPLVTADTLLTGDFSLGTIFEFDGLIVEMKEVGTDAIDGLITIYAYMRENLRVQDVDKKAFVKSASIATDILAITAGA